MEIASRKAMKDFDLPMITVRLHCYALSCPFDFVGILPMVSKPSRMTLGGNWKLL